MKKVKYQGVEDARPSTGQKMGRSQETGSSSTKKVKYPGQQDLGPKAGGKWTGQPDSRPNA